MRLLPNRNAYKLEGDFIDTNNAFGMRFDYRPTYAGYAPSYPLGPDVHSGYGEMNVGYAPTASGIPIGIPGDYNDYGALS